MPSLYAAVFDLDGTIVPNDLFAAWIARHVRRFPVRTALRVADLRALVGVALSPSRRDALKSHLTAASMQAWQSVEAFTAERDAFVIWVLENCVSSWAWSALDQQRASRRLLVLATASLDLYAEPIGRALGFDKILATPVDPLPGPGNKGIVGENLRGLRKVDLVAKFLSQRGLRLERDAISFSDSLSDFPLLQRSREAVLVSPSRRKQKAGAALEFQTVDW